jgi:hypothetical protein
MQLVLSPDTKVILESGDKCNKHEPPPPEGISPFAYILSPSALNGLPTGFSVSGFMVQYLVDPAFDIYLKRSKECHIVIYFK